MIPKKKKLVLAVEAHDSGGIKRVYFEKLNDYSHAKKYVRYLINIFKNRHQ
jgi:hypothetical protein